MNSSLSSMIDVQFRIGEPRPEVRSKDEQGYRSLRGAANREQTIG
jgi:hypothetical protein